MAVTKYADFFFHRYRMNGGLKLRINTVADVIKSNQQIEKYLQQDIYSGSMEMVVLKAVVYTLFIWSTWRPIDSLWVADGAQHWTNVVINQTGDRIQALKESYSHIFDALRNETFDCTTLLENIDVSKMEFNSRMSEKCVKVIRKICIFSVNRMLVSN